MERRLIGINMNDTIYSGIKVIIAEAQQPSWIRHPKQRDEMQIVKMMDTKKCAERETMMAKKEIMLDIYEQRRDAFYEYGLAESLDKTEFCGKLNSLHQKRENRCTAFFDWFLRNG